MTVSVTLLSSTVEHINGKAFMELTDDELKELGFRMGARKNIQAIISSIAVSYDHTLQHPANSKV